MIGFSYDVANKYATHMTGRRARIRIRDGDHTVPYGTDRWLPSSQAINCLATIIQSLRDNKPPLPVHIFESTSPILRSPGFEDEDEDSGSTELAEVLSDVAFCSRCLAVLSASEVGRTKRLARTHRALALLIAGQGAAELIH
jgi:hypothetical protein